MKHEGVTESPEGKWTRPEDYISALARRRTFRRTRRRERQSEPDSPRLLLSTLPFLALLGLLGVLAVAIMVAAFPGSQPQPKPPSSCNRSRGLLRRAGSRRPSGSSTTDHSLQSKTRRQRVR